MRRVHIGLNLKYEAAKVGFFRQDLALFRLPESWRRRVLGEGIEQFDNPEIVDRRTEKNRRQLACQIGVKIEFMAGAFN